MRAVPLSVLVAVVMVAFAGNSLLNRAAMQGGTDGPLAFAAIRLAAGAVMLAGLATLAGRAGRTGPGERARPLPAPSWPAAALLVYAIGFSLAYVAMDAGAGALILFAGVQVTMFAGGLVAGERVPPRRWAGAGMALAGLAWLLWPGPAAAVPLWAAGSMLVAAVAWGLFSLGGRGSRDPLRGTAAVFLWAAPVAIAAALLLPGAGVTARGATLAVISGALFSGLGYALWYAVLPRLDGAVAGLVQLTVPVIAVAGGVALLGEAPTWPLAAAGLLVLAGVAMGIGRARR